MQRLLLLLVAFKSVSGSQGKFLFSPIWLPRKTLEATLKEDPGVCATPQCKESAADLISNMNLSVDPCTNFFQFTCGGWINSHPVPSTESHWSQFNIVAETLMNQLKVIMEEKSKPSEPNPVKASKRLYQMCIEAENSDSIKGVKPLLDLLDRYGGWPIVKNNWMPTTFSWPTIMSDIASDLFIAPLIFIYVYVDRKNSSQNVINVDQPSFVIPRTMLVEPATYKVQLDAYKMCVIETATVLSMALTGNVNRERIKLQAEEMVNFEIELAKLSSPSEMRRNVIRTYNGMTLRQLQTWTDSASLDEINWLSVLTRMIRGLNLSIDWTERVVVKEVDYLFKLMQFLRDTPKRVIANYLNWRVVNSFSQDLTPKLRDLAFKFEKVFTGATSEQPRWKECIYRSCTGLSMAVGYSYVEKHFDNSGKMAALEMSDNIKSVFSDILDSLSWMDNATKTAAKHKVDTMSRLIGYPTWFGNVSALEEYHRGFQIGETYFQTIINSRKFKFNMMYSKLREPIDREEWTISPAVVNAYYNPQGNSIIFPAGILQPPFFTKEGVAALNYGAIGVVIGHEISHGFDDVGRHSDAQGNLAQWWSEATIETYLKKSQCFVSQYGAYRVPTLDSMLLSRATVNGVNTLGENIADNGGLHSALLAYRRHVAKHGVEQRLPGLEQFTPEQLFFISFATNWCETSTKESLLHEVLNDPHSPNEFRVVGSLENSEEFAKAFGCPLKPSTCTMW